MLYKEADRMKRWVMIVLAVVCTALTGCERPASEVENTQYVFSGGSDRGRRGIPAHKSQ